MTSFALPTPSRRWLPNRRRALVVAGWIGALLLAKIVASLLTSHHVVALSTPLPVIVLGTIIGLTYGLLGVGLVLIYRTNRIINFAHGQVGAFASAMFGLATVKWGVPYWVALPLALVLAGGVGAAAETGAVRRLRNAPRLVSIVVTLGIGQFLVLLALVVNSQASAGSLFPMPSGLPSFSIGALRVTQAYFGMLLLSPVLVIALSLFLRYSRFGLALRSAAANPEAARMAGIYASRMSSLAWAIAGGLSAFTAILTAPTQGFTSTQTFGPDLLLRAMTAAVIGRMQSFPAALAGGVGLGILEQILLWNYPRSGLVQMALFVIILVVLLLQRQRAGRDEEKGSWAAVQALRPVPEALRRIWLVRNMGRIVAVVFFALAALIPLATSNSLAVSFTGMIAFSIVGLSIGILTGLGGQLTLGQFAVAAIGAVLSYQVSSRTGDFPLALLYAGLVAAIGCVIVGLPALRIRGPMLAVTTLGFALATPAWLLAQPWMLGDGVDPGQPIVFGHALDTGKSYYYFALGLFVICFILAANVRRSGFGRLLVAVRDNEDAARAFTVRASAVKLQGYLLAGFLAGVGGAVYGHSLSSIGVSTFPVDISISVVVMTVLGGISVLAGPIIGALWIFGLPLIPAVAQSSLLLAASSLGILIVILVWPSGLVQFVEPLRDRLFAYLGRRNGIDVAALAPQPAAAADTAGMAAPLTATPVRPTVLARPAPTRPPAHGAVLLEARNLRKHFGGVKAVDGVSLSVRAGETVGLIGPNGAGKTTTFELLGGFVRADTGRVVFDRRDVTELGPESRGQLGLIRSFQDAALFPTMTVTECVTLALERMSPTPFATSVLGAGPGERRKQADARELVAFLGLDSYRDKQVRELSTGTRRIAEIACLVALRPTLLLLDEPSSGVAQRETEALGQLLRDIKAQLDVTMLIIEHDIPLIMGISDRIIAMADGRVLTVGTPEYVRNDPQVVEAYLGGSLTAIERSGGAASAAPAPRRTASRRRTTALAPAGTDPLADTIVLPDLSTVRGLGQSRAALLLQHFGTLDAICAASDEELQQVPGIGVAMAQRIRHSLNGGPSRGS